MLNTAATFVKTICDRTSGLGSHLKAAYGTADGQVLDGKLSKGWKIGEVPFILSTILRLLVSRLNHSWVDECRGAYQTPPHPWMV